MANGTRAAAGIPRHNGLPGLRGVERIGFTVPDLDQAQRFFVEVIGCEFVYSLGPFQNERTWMREHLNVYPQAVMRELRFFRCKNGPNFEIFQYESPDQKGMPPKNSDVGGHHLVKYVDLFADYGWDLRQVQLKRFRPLEIVKGPWPHPYDTIKSVLCSDPL